MFSREYTYYCPKKFRYLLHTYKISLELSISNLTQNFFSIDTWSNACPSFSTHPEIDKGAQEWTPLSLPPTRFESHGDFLALGSVAHEFICLTHPEIDKGAQEWTPLSLPPTRFERMTYCLGGSRSILLSYGGDSSGILPGGRAGCQRLTVYLRSKDESGEFPGVNSYRRPSSMARLYSSSWSLGWISKSSKRRLYT